jgi:epoxyqueuosine reductase QueG
MLETELKELARGKGSVRAGIARREAFWEAPPSADMRYLRPWANAVVSFAVTTGTDWIKDYLEKVTRLTIRDNLHHVYHEIYSIANVIASRLKGAGFKAHAIIPNGLFRPDHTFEKELPDHDVKPPLSLRYMAVGAGVGTFGWSGNVKEMGSTIDPLKIKGYILQHVTST